MPLFLLFFIVVPLVEIFILIQVGKQIGGLVTVALVIATAVIGLALLKKQGFQTMASARQKLEQGTIPAREMVDGIFLAVGGALLLTPGFVTDALGFCCLVPGLRQALLGSVIKHLKPSIQVNTYHTQVDPSQSRREQDKGRTIEGQYDRED